ncbi:aldehyde dehydrogenase family protein [Deinococcus malanensis]|uniref:aldehyde dehydrogenase family protein n=1 Tax=Deinococcus malanensis TaxID=1706855 RepID=UPI00362A56F6
MRAPRWWPGTRPAARAGAGYYVRPTVFANVTNDMTIAREEIFGPVLVILGYDSVEQAVEIGNDTDYGLSAYVSGADLTQVRKVGAKLRAGQVVLNGAFDLMAPFGGYKMSGNGREWGTLPSASFWRSRLCSATRPRPRVCLAEVSKP